MNPELKSLYRDTLLRHSREPNNRGVLENPDTTFSLKNPLCGDIITLYLKTFQEQISQAGFEAQCCSICMASASMLTGKVTGSSIQQGIDFTDSLIEMLVNPDLTLELSDNEEIQSLAGVKSFPSRIRCATLPWEAFKGAASRLQ